MHYSNKSDGGLRPIIRSALPQWHWLAIETGMTEQGVPDMNGASRGVEVWIENKKTNAWAVEVRIAQIGWHKRRTAEGCPAFIAVRRQNETKKNFCDQLWLCRSGSISALAEGGLRALNCEDSLMFEGGPKRWDWDRVDKYLRS